MKGAPSQAPIAASAAQAIAVTPDASPFSPSMKFIAFVAATIHATVSTGPSQPRSTVPNNGSRRNVRLSPPPTANKRGADLRQQLYGRRPTRKRRPGRRPSAMPKAASQHRPEIRVSDTAERRKLIEHTHSEQEGEHDADTTALGCRPRVAAARTRRVDRADPGHAPNGRSREQGQTRSRSPDGWRTRLRSRRLRSDGIGLDATACAIGVPAWPRNAPPCAS